MNKIFIVALSFIIISHQSYSKTKIVQSAGVVQSIEVLKKYITHEIPKKDIEYIMIFRSTTNHQMVELFLKLKVPVTAKEISKKLDKSASTISN